MILDIGYCYKILPRESKNVLNISQTHFPEIDSQFARTFDQSF